MRPKGVGYWEWGVGCSFLPTGGTTIPHSLFPIPASSMHDRIRERPAQRRLVLRRPDLGVECGDGQILRAGALDEVGCEEVRLLAEAAIGRALRDRLLVH